MFRSSARAATFSLLALAAILLTGCPQPPVVEPPKLRPPEVSISVHRLAYDLGLSVAEQTPRYVKLTNLDNWVFIYPDPNGQANINGRRFAARGSYCYGGEMYVPSSLETAIRGCLVKRYQAVEPPIIPDTGTGPKPPLTKVGHGHVMIDAGHGGPDGGARSVLGYNEKGVNLDVALKLRDYLQASKVAVSMTRGNDTFVELDDRAAKSNRAGVDLFVAIHADSAERSSAYGFTIYTSRGAGPHSHAAANYIERSMRAAGFNSLGVRGAGYRVLVKNDRPAVLVELGFLSNRAEATRLNNSAWRDAYARALASGIVEYLKHIP